MICPGKWWLEIFEVEMFLLRDILTKTCWPVTIQFHVEAHVYNVESLAGNSKTFMINKKIQ